MYKGIRVSNSYKILAPNTNGFISIEAENPKGYKAKVTALLVNAEAGNLFHEATATLSEVSARQKLTGVKVEDITRTLSAENVADLKYPKISRERTLETTISGSTIPALNYEDKAYASRSKVTLTPTGGLPIPSYPSIPPMTPPDPTISNHLRHNYMARSSRIPEPLKYRQHQIENKET